MGTCPATHARVIFAHADPRYICSDDYEECVEWKAQGKCETYKHGTILYCQQSCGFCEDFIVTWPRKVNAERTDNEVGVFANLHNRYPPPGEVDDDEEVEVDDGRIYLTFFF